MAPETLTYRFHKFRPSDRTELRNIAMGDGNIDLFVSALKIYMSSWAKADWLAEYDVERIACWCAIHLPTSIKKEVRRTMTSELRSSVSEQSKRVYTHFLEELDRNEGSKVEVSSQPHASSAS